MKRLFIDANVILDALLQRTEHDPHAAEDLLKAGEQRRITLLTSPVTIGVVLYHYQRSDADKKGPRLALAKRVLEGLLGCMVVVPMDDRHFAQSAASSFGDLEDGAQYFAVAAAGPLDAVVSRDPDFDGNIGPKRISAAQAMRLLRE